jgi:hypothetical protein
MRPQSFASTGPTFPIMATSETCEREQLSLWTSSAEDFPARTSATQGSAPESTANGQDYGASTPELLASYDPATSSWRTSQLCLDGALSEFSETWPRSGLMRSGIAYRLPPLVPLTVEIGSGLWPTPVANDSSNTANATARRLKPSTAHAGTTLVDAVRMWPTPTSRDWKDGSARACSTVPVNALLGRAVHEGSNGHGGSLSPTWVEWLMGYEAEWTALDASATPSSRKSRK